MLKFAPERTLIYLLWLGLYFYSYRYPFQIATKDYNPAYSDTPGSLQALKYIFYAAILGFGLILQIQKQIKENTRTKLDTETAILFVLFAYLCIDPIIVGLFSSGVNASWLLKVGIFPSLPAAMLLFRWRGLPILKGMARSIDIFILLAISVELVQFALLWLIGRMPFMTGEGNFLTIRFGSIWDSPNPFAFFLAFLIPFSYYRYDGLKRVAAIFFLVISLLATYSMTGIACFLCTVVLLSSITFVRSLFNTVPRRDWSFMLFTGLILFSLAAMIFGLMEYIPDFLETKSGSAVGHRASIDNFLKLGALDLLVGTGSMKLRELTEMNESGWLNILGNLGVVYFLVYASMTIFFIHKAYRLWMRQRTDDRTIRPIVVGSFAYIVSCAIGMLNLPEAAEFPTCFLVFFFFCVIIFLERETGTAASSPEAEVSAV